MNDQPAVRLGPKSNKSWIRRALGFSLRMLDRLVALDLLLFAAAILMKLYWFNKLLSVPYMDMTRTDKIIETGAILLASFWTLLLPTRGRLIALVLLNLILSFILYADVIYYRYFQDLITVPVLLQMGQVESLGGSITALMKTKDFRLFADLLIIIPYAVFVLWKGRSVLSNRPSSAAPAVRWRRIGIRIACSAAAFMLGFSLFFTNLNHATDTWAKGLFEKNWWNLSIYNVTGALGFHGYDVYRYAKLNWFNAEPVTAEQRSDTQLFMEDRAAARSELGRSDSLFGAYAGSNVLMVQVESLQNFMIGKSIGGKEITPVLNELIQESAYFSNFYHQTAQGRTSDADFAVNCSLQPMKSGSVFIQYASHEYGCLPKQLKNEGYSVNVFHPYQGGFWNRNVMYSNMKYDKFYSMKHYEMDERLGWSLGDKSFYRQSMDVITELPQPFHAFLISLTSHHPYKLPAAEKLLDTEELTDTMMGDYLQVIHYADAALGELIDRLKAEGLWDKTIFVLYGDHDNSILDWDLYARFMKDTSNKMEREQLLKSVPMLIHLPDGAHADTYEKAGGQLDITPTLMHLLGLSTSEPLWLGSPLLTDQKEETRIVTQRNGSWTDGHRYYIPSADGLSANGQCYAVDTGELVDSAICAPMTESAQLELTMSDRVVMGNLLRTFKNNGAVEVIAKSSQQ
ncbi:LTA synthase family protein [Paenibacillus pinisoli]|uniref:LTA synthase family protein n=1 Tax=Paenibacillus pinisoli TaxID=1276110 RepID=A0A3A6PDN5_9BACL|nr:LTA synthase family protein [Paenibacillus pinisoli]RJX38190.1 LTA synthase family protein [Paenibacillus pinisoli]